MNMNNTSSTDEMRVTEKHVLTNTLIKVETGIISCVLCNIADTMLPAESPTAVFEYPFKHRTMGPLTQ